MPLGKLIHTSDRDAVALWNANLEEGLKVAKAAGAKQACDRAQQLHEPPAAPFFDGRSIP